MHELIEELRDYHREKARQLLALDNATQVMVQRDGQRDGLLVVLDPFSGATETAHHNNEELILEQLRLTEAPIHRRVDQLSGDHRAFTNIVTSLLQMVSDASVSLAQLQCSIEEFLRHYDDHASGEENIFFPVADDHLESNHWRAIKARWQ